MNENKVYTTDENLKNKEVDRELIDFSLSRTWETPEYKLKYFVGGAQLTPYMKFKQFLMELKTREESCEELEYNYKKVKLEIKVEEEKIEFTTSDLQKELIELEIFQLTKDLRKYKFRLKHAYKERETFLKLVNEFLESDDGKLPNGESFMEVFKYPELESKFEHEYWTIRMAKQAACEMAFYGKVGQGNLDSIMMMPPEQQSNVLELASHVAVNFDKKMNLLMDEASNDMKLGYVRKGIGEGMKTLNSPEQTEDK
jgi:hypothetical protein|tara:strand:+ start:114 stop:881 length:768 start_codon:yes stop_codon:yes gene_type:complete